MAMATDTAEYRAELPSRAGELIVGSGAVGAGLTVGVLLELACGTGTR